MLSAQSNPLTLIIKLNAYCLRDSGSRTNEKDERVKYRCF